MDGLKTLDDLTEKVPRLLLVESASELAQVIKVTAIAVLHEEIEIVQGLLNVVEADNVWTSYPRKDANLTFQILLQQRIEIGLLNYFASKPFNSWHVRICLVHLIGIFLLLSVICKFTSGENDFTILSLTQYGGG